MKSNDTLKILNYNKKKFDTEIPLKNIKEVEVRVLSGDEILTITLDSEEKVIIDSSKVLKAPRFATHYDGTYFVTSGCLEKWNKRESSYQYDYISILKLKEGLL